MSLVVGIPACSREINGLVQHAVLKRYCDAVMGGVDAVPVLLPPVGDAMLAMLDRIDGLLLSGSPSNVMPNHYGVSEDLTPDHHDIARDATTLPLIRAAIARGLPLLAICRGLQELNVALGGSLHQKVHELPGRADHRSRPGTPEERYTPIHDVALSGELARVLGKTRTKVNSLHGQAIDQLADGLEVEAVAEDGTIEAVHLTNAPGWVMGVQWHPEFAYAANPDSVAIFAAFGQVCRAYAAGIKKAA